MELRQICYCALSWSLKMAIIKMSGCNVKVCCDSRTNKFLIYQYK